MNIWGPRAVNAYSLGPNDAETEIDGRWVRARAIGAPSIADRFVMAWHVFTGRADALYWPGQEGASNG